MSVTCSQLKDKVGEYFGLQTSSNILDPIMVSFEVRVGGMLTLSEGGVGGVGEAEDYFYDLLFY